MLEGLQMINIDYYNWICMQYEKYLFLYQWCCTSDGNFTEVKDYYRGYMYNKYLQNRGRLKECEQTLNLTADNIYRDNAEKHCYMNRINLINNIVNDYNHMTKSDDVSAWSS